MKNENNEFDYSYLNKISMAINLIQRGLVWKSEPEQIDCDLTHSKIIDETGNGFKIEYIGEKNTQHASKKAERIANYLELVSPENVASLVREIQRLKPFENSSKEWKANHDNQVANSRILKERPDMPVERVNAYNRMLELEAENKRLKEENESLSDRRGERELIQSTFTQNSIIANDVRRISRILDNVFNTNGIY